MTNSIYEYDCDMKHDTHDVMPPIDINYKPDINAALQRVSEINKRYAAMLGMQYTTAFTAERALVKHVTAIFDALSPWVCYTRQDAHTYAGVPDFYACIAGRFVALELKDDIGTASMQQRQYIKKIRLAGGLALRVRTLCQLVDTITGVLQNVQASAIN